MKNEELIKKLFKKEKIIKPVSARIQGQILIHKKETLIEIYLKNNKYSFFMFLVISFFFFMKKIGFSISFTKSIVVIFIGSILAISGIVTAGYYGTKVFVLDDPKIENNIYFKESVQPKEKGDSYSDHKKTSKRISLFVMNFNSDSVSNQYAKLLPFKIKERLKLYLGSNYLIESGVEKINPQYKILGSLIKPGEKYILTIKLIDNRATVLYFNSKQLKSINQIEKVIDEAVLEIVELYQE